MTSRQVRRWRDMGDRVDFMRFLEDHVNIQPEQLFQLDTRVEWIRTELWSQDGFRRLTPRFIPQGSWAQRTIIAPRSGQDFDADLLVHLRPETSWRKRSDKYLDALHEAVVEIAGDRYPVRLRTRCVEIAFDGYHVDLVPYVVRPRNELWPRGYIVNRRLNVFERVNPEGFTNWFQKQDATANRQLRIVTRLLKYLRDGEPDVDVPSVILTLLLGRQVHGGVAARGGYRDAPTAFHSLVTSLDRWLADRPIVPRIPDPSCWGVSFEHRLPAGSYQVIRRWIAACAVTADDAVTCGDRYARTRQWRRLFGDGYGEW